MDDLNQAQVLAAQMQAQQMQGLHQHLGITEIQNNQWGSRALYLELTQDQYNPHIPGDYYVKYEYYSDMQSWAIKRKIKRNVLHSLFFLPVLSLLLLWLI